MYFEAQEKRKPIGVLMIEHRLIERALKALEKKTDNPGEPLDVISFAELIDFFGTYADATHHGKEEDIMFEASDRLPLSDDLANVLVELRDEHIRFREFRKNMDAANRRVEAGEKEALSELVSTAKEFIPLLRQHIVKEDKVFFPGFDKLQSPEDRIDMNSRFKDFDAERIHEAYKEVIEKNE